MKKGFIERIEDNNVYVVFEDRTTVIYNIDQFMMPIKVDMSVKVINNEIKVFPPDEELKKEIIEITDKIFIPFKNRRKR